MEQTITTNPRSHFEALIKRDTGGTGISFIRKKCVCGCVLMEISVCSGGGGGNRRNVCGGVSYCTQEL